MLARVVSFEGVGAERVEALRAQIESDAPPVDIPAREMIVLFDEEGGRSLAILFFDNEDDYARGDAALNAMPTPDTPGTRTSVSRYAVAIRKAF